MESLEVFCPYTSYDLHWFPYEITKCKKLNDSTISNRALYGNIKNRMKFPKLDHNPVRYFGDKLKCSVCEKELDYQNTNQIWITALVGTDSIPMLANLCSKECENELPKPPENYVQFPHKGGADLVQPFDEYELWKIEMAEREKAEKENKYEASAEIKKESKNTKIDILKLLIL